MRSKELESSWGNASGLCYPTWPCAFKSPSLKSQRLINNPLTLCCSQSDYGEDSLGRGATAEDSMRSWYGRLSKLLCQSSSKIKLIVSCMPWIHQPKQIIILVVKWYSDIWSYHQLRSLRWSLLPKPGVKQLSESTRENGRLERRLSTWHEWNCG